MNTDETIHAALLKVQDAAYWVRSEQYATITADSLVTLDGELQTLLNEVEQARVTVSRIRNQGR